MIAQAELYPVALCRKMLGHSLQGRRCLYFIDNDSARDCLIAAHSDVPASMHIIYEFLANDLVSPSHSWFSRVQSASNAGDDPSRLNFSAVKRDWPEAKWWDPTAAIRELDEALLKSHKEDIAPFRAHEPVQ